MVAGAEPKRCPGLHLPGHRFDATPTTALRILCIVLAMACPGFAAEPPRLAPIKGVLLLRNGEVLSGTIAHTGDYYHVSLPRGEIRIKTSEVEKVAARLEDLYEEKRSRAVAGSLQDRLDLAEWCIEQKLIEPAAKELAAAAALDPFHPRITLFRRRLGLADRAEPPAPVPAHAIERGPSNDELDRLVRGLPSHAVETFTSTIQPLLVNNCTASGCHGPRSAGKLRLLRLSLAGPPKRRLTQRNLHSVWQVIDANQPEASPLLTQPIRPHGKAKGPIFSGHEAAQYRQLMAWVYDVTRQHKSEIVSIDELAKSLPASAISHRPKKPKPSDAKPSTHADGDLAALDDADQPDERPASEEAATPPARLEKPPHHDEEYVPVDAFDPEVFNRRYLPAR
jgi:hypothetical protein